MFAQFLEALKASLSKCMTNHDLFPIVAHTKTPKTLYTTVLVVSFIKYSKTCVKQPLKNRQNKDRNDKL